MVISLSTNQNKQELLKLLKQRYELTRTNKIITIYPEEGPHRRELYKKHLEFYAAGKEFKERSFMGGNRSGKTFGASYEVVLHLTGEYPDWWQGKRYNRPVKVYVGSETNAQLREAAQEILTGGVHNMGTGLIPQDKIASVAKKPNTPDVLDSVTVKHKSGENSVIKFLTYDQRRERWQGFKADIIWFDEEPPRDIYSEGIVRTINDKGDGMIILTFTPLKGISDVVRMYLPDGRIPEKMEHRYIEQVSWDDVPHIAESDKKAMKASMTATEIEARTKGIPSAGAGAIYPIPDEDIVVDPFPIPDHWKKWYGFDYGYRRAAAVFFAEDPVTQDIYIYDELVMKKAEPQQHYMALRARGADWMVGASEYALRYGDRKWIDVYRQDYGLQLIAAGKQDKAGQVATVSNLMHANKIKVFSTCRQWLTEKNLYHYEEKPDSKGEYFIKAEYNDLMDATQYGIITGRYYGRLHPDIVAEEEEDEERYTRNNRGRDPLTGY